MERFYRWGDKNNSVFNEEKFMLLRYGKNAEIKENTMYFTPQMYSVIEKYDNVRDLGIRVSNNAEFHEHIDLLIKKLERSLAEFFARS